MCLIYLRDLIINNCSEYISQVKCKAAILLKYSIYKECRNMSKYWGWVSNLNTFGENGSEAFRLKNQETIPTLNSDLFLYLTLKH